MVLEVWRTLYVGAMSLEDAHAHDQTSGGQG